MLVKGEASRRRHEWLPPLETDSGRTVRIINTGRNDPCPCGSGRKYKKCCESSNRLADFTWQKMRRTEGELTDILMEFAAGRYGPESLYEAWDEYTCWRDAPMDPESEPEMDTSFIPWFIFRWTPDNVGKEEGEQYPELPVALCYLEECPEQVEPYQRRLIEEMCSQPYSFFMVTGTEPGRHLLLRDLLLKRELCVLERTSSKMLAKGQILYTRVVTLDGVSIMVGCAPVAIPVDFCNRLIDFREKVRAGLAGIDWEKRGYSPGPELEELVESISSDSLLERDSQLRELYYAFRERILDSSFPQISNTDGEEMQPVILHYLLGCSPREAFDALKSLSLGQSDDDLLMDADFDGQGELGAVRVPWLKKGNSAHESWDNTVMGMLDIKGEKLVIEVNSRERAEAVRRKITRRLGRRATLKNTVFESLEAILAETTARPQSPEQPGEDLMAMPEVQEKVREMAAHHWDTWSDIPLPALKGQTPREAAGSPLGRERLEALLLDFEGKALGAPGLFDPDVEALRRELGLVD